MKLGIIARSEPRGLGNQTYEACRHLDPERVLLIDPGRDKRFERDIERFAQWDTTVLRWDSGRLREGRVRRWLRGLDVVYSAESPYDLRMGEWAHAEKCGLVLHANPEFVSPTDAKVRATWWAATPWRLAHLPAGTRVVPMPVPVSPIHHEPSDRFRLLHVAGWPTVGDRNGTDVVAEAAKHMTAECDLIIRGQHHEITRYGQADGAVRRIIECGNVARYWDLYRDADVLVMPRRYGGLCLPVQEAMASGLPVVMPDCSPNGVWPGPRVPVYTRGTVATRADVMPLHDVEPAVLAAALDDLASDPEMVAKLRREALEWAEANSWESLQQTWLRELSQAAW